MKSILYLSLFLACLSQPGCLTYKKCIQRYPPSKDTIRIAQVRDSIIYKDTTIYITIKGETHHDSILIATPVSINTEKLRSETPLAWAEAWIEDSYLNLNLTQKDTTILTRLDNAIKEAYHWRDEYLKIRVTPPPPPPERYIPKVYKYSFCILLILIVIGVYYLVRKFNIIKAVKTLIK